MPAANELTDRMQQLVAQARNNILAALDAQAKQYNRPRREQAFRRHDSVMVKRSGIDLRNTTLPAKYQARYLGPYRIEEVLANDNYRLVLPAGLRIHPVFHTSTLQLYRDPSEIPVPRTVSRPDPLDTAGEVYEVERVLGRRRRQGRTEYLVHWKGYDAAKDTWEPAEHLRGARQTVRDYLAQDQST